MEVVQIVSALVKLTKMLSPSFFERMCSSFGLIQTRKEIIRSIQESNVALLHPKWKKCILRKWLRSEFIVERTIEVCENRYESAIDIAAGKGHRCDAVFECLFEMLKGFDRNNTTLIPSLSYAIQTTDYRRFHLIWTHISINELDEDMVESILDSLAISYQHDQRKSARKERRRTFTHTTDNIDMFCTVWVTLTPHINMEEWLQSEASIREMAWTTLADKDIVHGEPPWRKATGMTLPPGMVATPECMEEALRELERENEELVARIDAQKKSLLEEKAEKKRQRELWNTEVNKKVKAEFIAQKKRAILLRREEAILKAKMGGAGDDGDEDEDEEDEDEELDEDANLEKKLKP